MSTVCPAWIFAFLRKCSADTPPNKTAAASSNVMLTGFIASRASAGRHAYSACVPNLNPVDPNTWSLPEPGHGLAHGLDFSGELHSEYEHLLWAPQAVHESHDEGISFSHPPVRRANRRRMDAN